MSMDSLELQGFYQQMTLLLSQPITKQHSSSLLESYTAWDSMSQLVIASWIHQETGHTVSLDELSKAKTIGELIAIYVSKL